MNNISFTDLQKSAFKVRERIVRLSANGGCFIGAALSCTDLLVYLYRIFLKINKNNLNSIDRNYFFLSKGHVVTALYAVLTEIG